MSCGNSLLRRWPKVKIQLWAHAWTWSIVRRAQAALVGAYRTKAERRRWLPRFRSAGITDEPARALDALLALAVPKEPVRTDADEPFGRDVHQKALPELLSIECARAVAPAFECDLMIFI